jgi:hypothetical protein
MPPDPRVIRETLVLTERLEREWQRKIPETDRRCTPWMPFPVPAFISLLFEALPEAPGDKFLEVGAGIGTKMELARELAGLDVTGIEVNAAYAGEAARRGLGVLIMDATDFAYYGEYDLIWFNRVYRDADLQARLEKTIWDEARPGAVVMCANLENPPPGWIIVLDDWEIRRGIWMKPLILP